MHFEFPKFTTNSDVCGIEKYELYENLNDDSIHPHFETAEVSNDETG